MPVPLNQHRNPYSLTGRPSEATTTDRGKLALSGVRWVEGKAVGLRWVQKAEEVVAAVRVEVRRVEEKAVRPELRWDQEMERGGEDKKRKS